MSCPLSQRSRETRRKIALSSINWTMFHVCWVRRTSCCAAKCDFYCRNLKSSEGLECHMLIQFVEFICCCAFWEFLFCWHTNWCSTTQWPWVFNAASKRRQVEYNLLLVRFCQSFVSHWVALMSSCRVTQPILYCLGCNIKNQFVGSMTARSGCEDGKVLRTAPHNATFCSSYLIVIL